MKRLSRWFLLQHGWERIYVGSSVVTYCEKCRRQRTHTCISKHWDEDDWVFEFECDHCLFDMRSRPRASGKYTENKHDPDHVKINKTGFKCFSGVK